ncbi:hypothetical protein ACFX13_028234 [Malus domestica]
MTSNEYYRRFTNLSGYDPEVAANPVEMLRRFRLGTKKKWRSIATSTPCATYQEFYEVLVGIEDSENMPSESEDEEEKDGNQRNDDKGKGILGSVGKATIDAILVDRWGIGLYIALRISRGPNSLPYHHLHRPSKFQDLVVMSKMVVEVLIIIRTTQLLILQVVSVLARPSLSGWLSSISERFYVILAIFSRWIPMVPGGQPQQVEIATSIARSSRQSSQPR